jgi:hypothetical protein
MTIAHPRSQPRASSAVAIPNPLDRDPSAARSARARAILLRGIVWGVIGIVYAPLFVGLVSLFARLGVGVATYACAAGLAGAAGAALYGARELALVGTGIGVVLGLLLLIALGDTLTFEQAVLVASCVAATIGLVVVFPGRCTRKVPGKVMAGLASGALCGAALAIAEPLHPAPFSTFALLAFLVSVNGVLYVASVRWWVGLAGRLGIESRPCNAIEALVIAVLAGIAAGSVWLMAAPLLGETSALVREVSAAVYRDLPLALLGGIFGGALAGSLLEALGFAWVHDV